MSGPGGGLYRKCENCGQFVDASQKFCSHCGKRQPVADVFATVPVESTPAPAAPPPVEAKEPRPTRSGLLSALAIAGREEGWKTVRNDLWACDLHLIGLSKDDPPIIEVQRSGQVETFERINDVKAYLGRRRKESPPPTPTKPPGVERVAPLILAAIVLLFVGVCAWAGNTSDDGPSSDVASDVSDEAESSTTTSDDGRSSDVASDVSDDAENSSLACDHWRNIMGDVGDGVLTEVETREKLKEVDGNAVIATPAVQSAARRMLAALTQNDATGMEIAIRDMDSACDAVGH